MNVLFVNHTAEISGAERSLLELITGLPPTISAFVASPPGPLADAVGALGVPVASIPGTEVSFRLDPRETPRGLADIARTAFELGKLVRCFDAEIVHANTARAGLAVALSPRIKAGIVAHIRDCLPRSLVGRLTRIVIGRRADVVVANSRYTADDFRAVTPRCHVRTVYNPIDFRRFDPTRLSRTEARERLNYTQSQHLIGVVAQLTPWKGQDVAIDALALLHEREPHARLLLVGSAKFTSKATRYDNLDYERSLHERVQRLGLGASVDFLGERVDIPEILRALDVLLLPSWEEPFGRVAAESMAMETPVLATDVGGTAEIISDGVDGFLLPPRVPERWAESAALLLVDRNLQLTFGQRGREKVERQFTVPKHAAGILAAYKEAADKARRAR